MSANNIRAIHHVSYTVSDIDRSVRFYSEGLGFDVLDDRRVSGEFPSRVTGFEATSLRIVHLRGHGQGLELIQYESPVGAKQAVRTCDVGSSHLCYVVGDIDRAIEHLESYGARFLSPPQEVEGGPNAGNRCVYFLDPDGIPMELSEPRI